jgi:nitroimidazol reductase NimA-like FMN-containing flavoprotein (pyridoxamine 5'-phosphate oxidase superfamily)
MDAYPTTERSRVKRMHQRGHYDRKTVFEILDAAMLAHIGYVIDGQPYVTPTSFWRHGERLYWHGSSASRMLRSQSGGVPVCVTVTHMDGFVMARSGFHHSINYRAVMAFGTAAIVDDAAEKRRALDHFVDGLFPGRNATLRPIDAQEFKATTLVGMTIDEASAKIRTGGPVDDEPDYALPIWAGVIPLRTVVDAPIADPRNLPGVAASADIADYAPGARLDEVLARLRAKSPAP